MNQNIFNVFYWNLFEYVCFLIKLQVTFESNHTYKKKRENSLWFSAKISFGFVATKYPLYYIIARCTLSKFIPICIFYTKKKRPRHENCSVRNIFCGVYMHIRSFKIQFSSWTKIHLLHEFRVLRLLWYSIRISVFERLNSWQITNEKKNIVFCSTRFIIALLWLLVLCGGCCYCRYYCHHIDSIPSSLANKKCDKS